MAFADYYRRGAVAISQVVAGFDEQAIQDRLWSIRLELAFDRIAAESPEGRSLLDLLVRIAARLYPAIAIRSEAHDSVAQLRRLALEINPSIDLSDAPSNIGVWVGPTAPTTPNLERRIFAGASAWNGRISTRRSVPIGGSANPIGPGVSACLAMANIFRMVFLPTAPLLDQDLNLPAISGWQELPDLTGSIDLERMILAGVGAIGNGAMWTLSRLPVKMNLELVDPERIELGNLQRYVMAGRGDEGILKVEAGARTFTGPVHSKAHAVSWSEYVELIGQPIPPTLVAVDSSNARRMVQASLPEFVVNAWTQPADLGVSTHFFDGPGACLYCLYLPDGPTPNEDQIYADALGIPDQLMQIRNLLHTKEGTPREILQLIGQRLGVEEELILRFEGQDLRKLYVEGICGGAVLPLGRLGSPRSDVHVPLAHQSALAGILLVASAIQARLQPKPGAPTQVTRLNLMNAIDPGYVVQSALKDPRGICICQDRDYLAAYRAHFLHASARRRAQVVQRRRTAS
jgi:hypothetical protein